MSCVTPQSGDVLFGSVDSGHPGTKRYQDLLLQNQERYFGTSESAEKQRIIHEIIYSVLRNGRFLEQYHNKWIVVPRNKAYYKTSMALHAHLSKVSKRKTVVASPGQKVVPVKRANVTAPTVPISLNGPLSLQLQQLVRARNRENAAFHQAVYQKLIEHSRQMKHAPPGGPPNPATPAMVAGQEHVLGTSRDTPATWQTQAVCPGPRRVHFMRRGDVPAQHTAGSRALRRNSVERTSRTERPPMHCPTAPMVGTGLDSSPGTDSEHLAARAAVNSCHYYTHGLVGSNLYPWSKGPATNRSRVHSCPQRATPKTDFGSHLYGWSNCLQNAPL